MHCLLTGYSYKRSTITDRVRLQGFGHAFYCWNLSQRHDPIGSFSLRIRMALVNPTARSAVCPHHLPNRFVPFRSKPPGRRLTPVPAAEPDALPDALPAQIEQVSTLAQSLTDSAAALGIPPTTLLATAAVAGACAWSWSVTAQHCTSSCALKHCWRLT